MWFTKNHMNMTQWLTHIGRHSFTCDCIKVWKGHRAAGERKKRVKWGYTHVQTLILTSNVIISAAVLTLLNLYARRGCAAEISKKLQQQPKVWRQPTELNSNNVPKYTNNSHSSPLTRLLGRPFTRILTGMKTSAFLCIYWPFKPIHKWLFFPQSQTAFTIILSSCGTLTPFCGVNWVCWFI